MRQQKDTEALREIDLAARLAPESENVHFVRGQLLRRVGRGEEAKAELAKAQKIFDADLAKDRRALGEEQEPTPDPELAKQPER
jgi:Flp pilus assembly protein TadD